MHIRRATLSDAPLLAALNYTVQQLHYERRPEVFKPPAVNEEMVRFYQEALAESYCFICYIEDLAVGYVHLRVSRRPENPFTHTLDDLLIEQISVNPDHQGKGCGQALMQAAYDLARQKNIHRVILGVWDFNTNAIDFYRKQGFRIYHHRMELLLE